MRARAVVRFCFLVLAISIPTFVFGQFQQPTDEELKMTADPKAPGAAAVYLNYEDITDDQLHYETVYARIKVLQEKGKELATVQIAFERGSHKVVDIKGRTIHPDGTIIPLAGKPEELLVTKKSESQESRRFLRTPILDTEVDKRVFNLPSVEVGSIIEYSYQINTDDHYYSSPYWEVQRPYFIHHARFVFRPWKGFLQGSENVTSNHLVDPATGALDDTLLWTATLPPRVAHQK